MKILVCMIGIIVVLVAGAFLVLLTHSSGKIKPVTDADGNEIPGSIAQKIQVEINGEKQGMIIRGEDTKNPVLLFLHGGPGVPEYFLSEIYETGLEKYFTICWWEQRGGSLSADVDRSTITVDQLIDDTGAVADYLCERFGQEKVYLMGHSWGTFLGIQAAEKYPEKFYAYIGMSQITDIQESEVRGYDYMLNEYKKQGNQSKVKAFEKYDVKNNPKDMSDYRGSLLRDNSMHALGVGTMHSMHSVITDIFFPNLMSDCYTISEKLSFWRAKQSEENVAMREVEVSTNLFEKVQKLEIPFYNFAGEYDHTVDYDLQKEYFETVDAPVKGFYTFEESAHSPIFEEPERVCEIMTTDILNQQTSMADTENMK